MLAIFRQTVPNIVTTRSKYRLHIFDALMHKRGSTIGHLNLITESSVAVGVVLYNIRTKEIVYESYKLRYEAS